MLSTYEEMSEKASRFYEDLQIKIHEQYVDLAVRSLTMPQYAKEYQDKYNQYIGDHRALATVGDAVCEAFVMLKEYNDALTSDDLDKKKECLQNEGLNLAGEKMLNGVLFASNNDLESNNEDHPNKKAYATAFEAVIGFIAIIEGNSFDNIDKIWNKYVLNATVHEDKIQVFKFFGFKNQEDCNRFVDNIRDRRLPCGHPISFNDPFEGVCFYRGLSAEENDFVKVLKSHIETLVPFSKRYLTKISDSVITNKSIVSCFCKKTIFDEEKTCDLMWAHYANNHNGVLVEYEFDNNNLLEDFDKDENGYKIYNNEGKTYHFSAQHLELKEVEYVRDKPEVVFQDGITHSKTIKFLYAKPMEWKYEKEIRIIAMLSKDYIFDLNNHYSLEYKEKCLKSIYFGLNIEPQYKKLICDALKIANIKCDFYEAFIDGEVFYVQYRKIN